MSVDFLKSEAGKAFTSSLVRALLEAHERPRATPTAGDMKEERFQNLINDFMNSFPDPTILEEDLRPHLVDMYQQRFYDLYPTDAHAADDYYRQVALVDFVLAQLTENVWQLDTGKLKGYPVKRERPLGVYHLQWAREALGWWVANLTYLNYYLNEMPQSRLSEDAVQALLAALDDETRTRLAALNILETEEGCPVC